jgi:outer membrane protein assembly factor BamB
MTMTMALANPTGWRHDGTGHAGVTQASLVWEVSAATWSFTQATPGNATPVMLKDQVCFTSEPTLASCVDAATGALRWTASNDVVEALPADEAASVREDISGMPALQVKLKEAQRAVSRLRREARRGDEAASAGLEPASQLLDALKRDVDALAIYMTPADLELIGYASSTPTTDGESLYVMLGNGVVSRFSASGERMWSTWLGAPPQPMRGYEHGSVTSPQLVGGVLLVGHGHLQALSPADGSVVWRHEERWLHYGTPALLTVGGVEFAALPDGQLVRIKDGEVVAEGLGDLWYTGPIAVGQQLWYVGSKGDSGRPDNARAQGWTLEPDGTGGVLSTALFSRDLSDSERIYAAPLAHDGLLYVATRRNHLMVLDAVSGEDVYERALGDELRGDGYASITSVVGPRGPAIMLGGETADYLAFAPGRVYRELSTSDLPGGARATPVFLGDGVFVRTLEALYRFGP